MSTLTIRYDGNGIPMGGDESDLALFRLEGMAWVAAAGSVVEVDANTVSGEIAGFSVYDIMTSSSK